MERVELPQVQFINEAPSLTDLQLVRTHVYYDESTNPAAQAKTHYTEAELVDSALDVVRMMRDPHHGTPSDWTAKRFGTSSDLQLRPSTWAAKATLDPFTEETSSWST